MSIRINLLPHREAARKARRELFYRLCALTVILGGITILGVYTVIDTQINRREEGNQFLKREIAGLDRQIEQIKRLKDQLEALKSRKQVIESLQMDRNDTVHLLSELVKQVPEGTFLKRIKQEGSKITLEGYAQTNASVSVLMRNLEASLWLEAPQLIETHAVMLEKRHVQEFSMTVQFTRKKAEAAAKPAAANAAGAASGSNQTDKPKS